MGEILRFLFCAVFLICGIIIEVTAVVGVNRFDYDMNRLHAAGMCDSLGLFLIILACIIYTGFSHISLKLFAAVLFQWLTSPVSGHLIGRLIYETDPEIYKEARIWKP